MRSFQQILGLPAATLGLLAGVAGCSSSAKCDYMGDITPTPLGTLIDPVWRAQEANAEASDFVVHEHEWEGNTATLNEVGKNHLKQIAARANDQKFPILIEPSSKTVREETEFRYPVHNDDELDARRRLLVVEALQVLGVTDAEERVVLAPAMARGYHGFEARQAFRSTYQLGNRSGGAGGGFGGGGAGGGGFGR